MLVFSCPEGLSGSFQEGIDGVTGTTQWGCQTDGVNPNPVRSSEFVQPSLLITSLDFWALPSLTLLRWFIVSSIRNFVELLNIMGLTPFYVGVLSKRLARLWDLRTFYEARKNPASSITEVITVHPKGVDLEKAVETIGSKFGVGLHSQITFSKNPRTSIENTHHKSHFSDDVDFVCVYLVVSAVYFEVVVQEVGDVIGASPLLAGWTSCPVVTSTLLINCISVLDDLAWLKIGRQQAEDTYLGCCHWSNMLLLVAGTSFDKYDLPHKLQTLFPPLLRGRGKMGFGSFFRELNAPNMSIEFGHTQMRLLG
ncbi:hypothetical protein Tco_1273696 [Tanacetum coccineum]